MSESASENQFPKLHNAMWPGLVGKGPDAEEPAIDLDTMLRMTAEAEVDGVKFDGVDLFLYNPHVDIDITDDDLKDLADKIQRYNFVVGSVVAPVWFDGAAMGSQEQRDNFVTAVGKACRIATRLRELGVRPYGVVRIDSATSVSSWSEDPVAATTQSRRPSGGPRILRKTTANVWRRRARSAGEVCTPGERWLICWK